MMHPKWKRNYITSSWLKIWYWSCSWASIRSIYFLLKGEKENYYFSLDKFALKHKPAWVCGMTHVYIIYNICFILILGGSHFIINDVGWFRVTLLAQSMQIIKIASSSSLSFVVGSWHAQLHSLQHPSITIFTEDSVQLPFSPRSNRLTECLMSTINSHLRCNPLNIFHILYKLKQSMIILQDNLSKLYKGIGDISHIIHTQLANADHIRRSQTSKSFFNEKNVRRLIIILTVVLRKNINK